MENKNRLKRHAFSLIVFLSITGVVVLMIEFANWLPLIVQQETLRRYGSVEEIRKSLPGLHIYVPTYFPQSISWPPEHLFAQGKPFPLVLMKFKYRDRAEEALIITQSGSEHGTEHMPGSFDKVLEKAPYELRGRQTVLEAGACRNGEQCSRISWREGQYQVSVFMAASPFELIKIANSMLH